MQIVIMYFFVFLLAIYTYGYFMYSHKITRKYIKPCSTIYILDEDMSDFNDPEALYHDKYVEIKQDK